MAVIAPPVPRRHNKETHMASSTTQNRPPAVLMIPAAYLEDARAALIDEIETDGDALQGHGVSQDDSASREDVASSMRILRREMQLLDQVLDARNDTEVTAHHDSVSTPVTDMLEAMVRVFTARLVDEMNYGPLDMGAVLELTDRLRWAAQEAMRIEPTLDSRTRET